MIQQLTFPYNTHQKILEHAVKNSTGAVLEIGCGHGSTPLLHELCKGRKLVTLENDLTWINNFLQLANHEHEMYFAPNYDEFDSMIRGNKWDVVLIDHETIERRNIELRKVLHAKFVILHDSENQGYEEAFELFKYKYTYTAQLPNTSVLSNNNNLKVFQSL